MTPSAPSDRAGLRIATLETLVLDVPLARPHRFAVMTAIEQHILLVRVRTADGVIGTGEATTPGGPWWGGESVEGMQVTVERYLAPLVLGAAACDVQRVRRELDRHVAGNLFAKAAVETAMVDAWARTVSLPLHHLLGGAVRDAIEVTWAIGATDHAEAVDEAEAKLDGVAHGSIKLKMGAGEPDADVARVEKIAAPLADHASLRVDLNGAWDELTATRLLPRLAAAGVDLVEQPTPGWDVDALARLRARGDVAIMADESLRTEHDALRLAMQRAADVFSLKVTKSGGHATTGRIAAVAQAAGIACHGGTSIESGIGTATALHRYCTLPAVTFGSELFGPRLLTDDLLASPLQYRDGLLHLPGGPGLGVEVDEEALIRHRRD